MAEDRRVESAFAWWWIPVLAAGAISLVLILTRHWHRLDAGSVRTDRRGAEGYLGAAGLLWLAGAAVVSIVAREIGLVPAEGEAPVEPTLLQSALLHGAKSVAELCTVGLLAWMTLPWCRKAFLSRTKPARAAAIGAIALLLVWPVVVSVMYPAQRLIDWLAPYEPDQVAHATLSLLLSSPIDEAFLVMVIVVLVLTPVTEEILYRGLLQEGLARLSGRRWTAILMTSVIFAAMHWGNTEPHALVGLFALSIAFGWAYERTGRLIAPIVMHVLFNAGNLLFAMMIE